MINVIKIGGSLFDLPDFKQRVAALVSLLQGEQVMIPGGGSLTDVIRTWDQIHALGEERSHELALQTLSISARMVAACSKTYQLTRSLAELEQIWNDKKIAVLDPCKLVLEDSPLAHHWDITSDSIAAWVATKLPGAQLILAKSIDLPKSITSLTDLSNRKLVDPCFPEIATSIQTNLLDSNVSSTVRPSESISIQWVNLRQSPPQLTRLQLPEI